APRLAGEDALLGREGDLVPHDGEVLGLAVDAADDPRAPESLAADRLLDEDVVLDAVELAGPEAREPQGPLELELRDGAGGDDPVARAVVPGHEDRARGAAADLGPGRVVALDRALAVPARHGAEAAGREDEDEEEQAPHE